MRRCRAVQLVVMFNCRSEGVLQNFSEDVFEMDRNIAFDNESDHGWSRWDKIGTHANVAS